MIEIIPNWHPVFVHFPIAFATASVFFLVAARLLKDKTLAALCPLYLNGYGFAPHEVADESPFD